MQATPDASTPGWTHVETLPDGLTIPKDPSVWPSGHGDDDIWPNTPDALDRAIAAQAERLTEGVS